MSHATVTVVIHTRDELTQKLAALRAELHTLRNCRSEDELLDEIDQVEYLLGGDDD